MELLYSIVGLALFLLAVLASQRRSHQEIDIHYRPIPHLLTPAERSFHAALKDAIGATYVIAPKVRVADVLEGNHVGALNRIARKHFDFVLCDQNTFAIFAAIELDDASHRRDRARKSDDVKNAAAQSANFALIRFRAQSSYSVPGIRQRLNEQLRLGHRNAQPAPESIQSKKHAPRSRLAELQRTASRFVSTLRRVAGTRHSR